MCRSSHPVTTCSAMTISPHVAAPASYGDAQRTGLTANDLFEGVTEHLFFSQGASTTAPTDHDLYMALSYAVRDRLMARHLAYKDLQRQQQMITQQRVQLEQTIRPLH